MHNFHCELHFLLLFILFLLAPSNYSLNLAETTFANAIHHLELVDKLLIALNSYCYFVSKVHAVALFEKFVISKHHISHILHFRAQDLIP